MKESAMMKSDGLADLNYYTTFYGGRDYRFYNFLLNQVIQYSRPGKILDVGSGVGLFIEACCAWGWDCQGIEGSADGIEVMQKRNPHLNSHHRHLQEPFPFEGETFQTVVINQVIEHLETPTQQNCLSESFRVLKKGGALILHSPSAFNKKEREGDPTHIGLLAPFELRKMMEKEGFHSLIDINEPINLLGRNYIADKIVLKLYRIFKMERLSSTASYVGYK